MTTLLKSFGKGCLYILVLPALLVVLAFYAVFGVVMFLYVVIKGTYLFFTGRSFSELPEDVKARAILEGRDDTPSVQIEEIEKKPEPTSDYASHYYVPLSQDIPAPKDETFEKPNEEVKNDGGEQ